MSQYNSFDKVDDRVLIRHLVYQAAATLNYSTPNKQLNRHGGVNKTVNDENIVVDATIKRMKLLEGDWTQRRKKRCEKRKKRQTN